ADANADIDADGAVAAAEAAVASLRERLANDLDTAGALLAVDEWAKNPSTPEAATVIAVAVDGLLGVRIS
ncbi:MAG: cysteine--1-D-myo-inosityl 2-amino-2-deoxy-alpha-D-glucopyranoside ligase, partial [Corynebacterium casei]